MSDPNGWVTSPPTTLVKVHGVSSRESLNGALGVVLQYSADRARYVVHMTVTQEQVSLKQDNLTKASWMEQMMGQYQLLRHDRNVHQSLRNAYNSVQARTGIQPEYVGAAAGFVLLVAFYMLGFTRVLMIITFALIVLTVIAPDIANGASRDTILRNAPQRCRDLIRESIPVVGPKIAANNYMMMAFVGLVVAVFVRSMLPASSSPALAFSSSGPPPPGMPLQHYAASETKLKDHYYKLGFDDATALKPFGASLEEEANVVPPPDNDPLDDYAASYDPPPPQRNPLWNYIGILMSSGYIYRTLKKIGSDANGQIQLELIKQNIGTMDPVSKFMLGFSVYNLFKAIRAVLF